MKSLRWTSLLAMAVLFAACGDTTGPEGAGNPPVLPEVESLLFDLDFFSSSAAPTEIARQVGPGSNWAAGALTVGVANLAVVIHMAVPVATWRAVTNRVPIFEDGQWHWRVSVTEGNRTYGGHLVGFEEDGDRVFEMRVTSSALGLTDFLWFTGRAPIGGTTGEWQFFDPNDPGTVRGRIVWEHPDANVWTLTFFADAGPEVGNTLMYVVDENSRTVTYTDASANETWDVGWDQLTSAGYIVAPNYNGGVMACWGTALENVDCAP